MRIERYTPAMQPEWDAFAAASRNATFLHQRGYMDYHADRFADHSLVARADSDGSIVALLPANEEADTLVSHRGLTYGGWLTPLRHFGAATMLQLFEALRGYMAAAGFRRLVYRPVPHIYHRYPAEDDLYALWRMGAVQDRVMAASTVSLRRPRLLDHGTKNAMNRAVRSGAAFGPSDRLDEFWGILEDVLATHHGARPVHTLDEMRLLQGRFPDRIRLFAATLDGRMEAGVLMYRCGTVDHAQYTAASETARRMRLLPALYSYIAENECAGADWLDIGTSCEDAGRILNEGLDAQKSGLGGRCTVYQSFTLDL